VPDRYASFADLAEHERCGVDFALQLRRAGPLAIVAPHGGGIEPGTQELADAVAAEQHSFYCLVGLKRAGNARLHLSSTRFDEPLCSELLSGAESVLTIHGESGENSGEAVFVGGLDRELGLAVSRALAAAGFDVQRHGAPQLQGTEPTNLCNRGRSGRGVQLELARALRARLFRSLTRQGRAQRTQRFTDLVAALRSALQGR
jgi:phage replication-related protein YjqB (UPF0714/DUF867 family)